MSKFLKFKTLKKTEEALTKNNLKLNRDCVVVYEIKESVEANTEKRVPVVPLLLDHAKQEVRVFYTEKTPSSIEVVAEIAECLAEDLKLRVVRINANKATGEKLFKKGYIQEDQTNYKKEKE